MAKRLICSNGHQWEVPERSADDAYEATCPVCGDAVAPPTLNAVPDELPPLPRPVVRPQSQHKDRLLVPGYEILEQIGRGGMGVVYKARQINLNRIVALKMLLAGPHADGEDMARFRAEAETIARLQHPNIVHIYDIGEADGHAYLALEYAAGGTLAAKLAGRPQPPSEAAQLVAVLARAIHLAHQAGIVHRDLKPANILLVSVGVGSGDRSGDSTSHAPLVAHQPKITDFGLAKRLDGASLTQTGVVMGTPNYMAPEQVESKSKEIGPATDIYALGAILYEMLTGRPPFLGGNSLETVRQVAATPPRPPSEFAKVPEALEKICLRCLEKSPRRRYTSALELADHLDRFREDKTSEIVNLRPPNSTARRPILLIAALGAALVCIMLGWLIWNATKGTKDGRSEQAVVNGRTDKPQLKEPAKEAAKAESIFLGPPGWQPLQIAPARAGERFEVVSFPTREIGYTVSNRAVYKTEDAGKTWKRGLEAPFLQNGRIGLIRFQNARIGWMAANSALYETTDGGDTWLPVDLKLRVRDLVIGNDGWMLVGGLLEPGGYPDRLLSRQGPKANWEDLDFDKRANVEGRIKSLVHIAIAGPQTAFVACNDQFSTKSCVLRTADGGQSWKTVLQTDKARMTGLHFADLKRGWVIGDWSLWATEDGGDTWKPQLNPEDRSLGSMAFDPHGGSFGIILFNRSNFPKILVTTDGKQWRSVGLEVKGSIVSATVIDSGCAMLLLEDGRLLRYLLPNGKP